MSHELSVILSYGLAGGIMVPLFASRVWRWRKLKAEWAAMAAEKAAPKP